MNMLLYICMMYICKNHSISWIAVTWARGTTASTHSWVPDFWILTFNFQDLLLNANSPLKLLHISLQISCNCALLADWGMDCVSITITTWFKTLCLRPGLANVCDLIGKSLHSRLLSVMSSLRPNINMHILHTVLYTFPKTLTRRVCITIKSFFSWWSFPLFS